MKRWMMPLPLCALLAACSVLPSNPQVSLYRPAPEFAVQHPGARPVAWRLALVKLQAGGLLASPRILVQPAPGQVEVYPQAHWSEPAPALVEQALLQALEADARLAVVERSSSGLSSDFQLHGELRDFQIELESGRAQAVLRLRLSLVAQPQGRVVASTLFESRQPAAGAQLEAAIPAFSAALSEVARQVADWVVAQGEGAFAALQTAG